MKQEDPNWFEKSATYMEMNRLMDLDSADFNSAKSDIILADHMRPDIAFESESDEIEHLRRAQSLLRNEILIAYKFLDEKHLLETYKEYRGL